MIPMSDPNAAPALTYLPHFVVEPALLFARVLHDTVWDERMRARRTASWGIAYNYSGIRYADVPFPAYLAELVSRVAQQVHHPVNNCLANWYADGTSTMGFHSDATVDLVPESTVAIVSLGEPRTLTFRPKEAKRHHLDYALAPGSLLVMAPSVQRDWQHALLAAEKTGPRISLTFRWVQSSASAPL